MIAVTKKNVLVIAVTKKKCFSDRGHGQTRGTERAPLRSDSKGCRGVQGQTRRVLLSRALAAGQPSTGLSYYDKLHRLTSFPSRFMPRMSPEASHGHTATAKQSPTHTHTQSFDPLRLCWGHLPEPHMHRRRVEDSDAYLKTDPPGPVVLLEDNLSGYGIRRLPEDNPEHAAAWMILVRMLFRSPSIPIKDIGHVP